MKLTRDVGLIGLAGSGKDTAAMALTACGWRRKAFADKLKHIAYNFGWDGNKDEKGRKLLQDLGMAARRYNLEFWINQAYQSIQDVAPEMARIPFVWTDVRFENEADFIRKRGGIIIRIKRPGQLCDDIHESELNQFQIRADYEVVNAGTIEDLHKKILNLIEFND